MSNAGMTASRGKSVVEETEGAPNGVGSRLESKNTDPHREWVRTKGTPQWDSCVQRLELPIFTAQTLMDGHSVSSDSLM